MTERTKVCGSVEFFNSSKQMTRGGRFVQRGLVSSSIANSHLQPMSQLYTHYAQALHSWYGAAWVVQKLLNVTFYEFFLCLF